MFFFFKQKTAYEMRISDWSSDVCSSDLEMEMVREIPPERERLPPQRFRSVVVKRVAVEAGTQVRPREGAESEAVGQPQVVEAHRRCIVLCLPAQELPEARALRDALGIGRTHAALSPPLTGTPQQMADRRK